MSDEFSYRVGAEVSFSASHQLRGYKADLEPLHGHNFRVVVTLEATELEALDLVLDFIELEEHIRGIVAPFDHQHVNEIPPFDRINPTTENMARHFFEELGARINDERVRVRRVQVWEAPTYSASYGRRD